MLFLHQYPGIWGLPSLSPFCIKVETYLRMVNIPYTIVVENNPRRGPKNKMPVLRDNNKIISDSSFIIFYLKQKYGDKLDDGLSVNDAAKSLAIQRLIEESLYYVILFSRWIDPNYYMIINKSFSTFFPPSLAPFFLAIIRRNLFKQCYAQGMARHSAEEVYLIGESDLNAIAQLFSADSYFLGEIPHTIDATLFAFLETIRLTPTDNPLRMALQKHQRLTSYCTHMRKKYF